MRKQGAITRPEEPQEEVLLARQPIFDADLSVVAYELLFRSGEATRAHFVDGDQASSRVIRNTFMDADLERVVGPYPAHLNITANLVRNGTTRLLPRSRVVLELQRDVLGDRRLALDLRDLAEDGYDLALDDFSWTDDERDLLPTVSMIKVDVSKHDLGRLEQRMDELAAYPVELAAVRVETPEILERCIDLGFHLFQGYFLCRPNAVRGRSLPTSRLVVLQLLKEVFDPDVTIPELERLIRRDVSLSYRLLRIINSAYYSLPRKVHSIRDALVLLGLRFIRQWVTLLALAGLENKPPELFKVAMVRARMAEGLARQAKFRDTDPFFVTGLFSVLDAAMDQPLPTLLRDLPLERPVVEALLHRQGVLGEALDCVIAHEQGAWSGVSFRDLPTTDIQSAYFEAVDWAADAGSLLT